MLKCHKYQEVPILERKKYRCWDYVSKAMTYSKNSGDLFADVVPLNLKLKMQLNSSTASAFWRVFCLCFWRIYAVYTDVSLLLWNITICEDMSFTFALCVFKSRLQETKISDTKMDAAIDKTTLNVWVSRYCTCRIADDMKENVHRLPRGKTNYCFILFLTIWWKLAKINFKDFLSNHSGADVFHHLTRLQQK